LSDTTEVDDLHVEVKIKGVELWSEHHKINKKFDDTFQYDLKWAVPSIAPRSDYDVTFTGTGNASGVKGKVLCVEAKFSL